MSIKNQYQSTIRACFTGFVVQAVVNNFVPLLFLTLQRQYGIPLSQITALITINFALQLSVDLVSIFVVDRIGYRVALLLAHGFAVAGIAGLTFLPQLVGDAFTGLLIAICLYAVGGGLLEVLLSPIVEACPNEHKEQTMSMLHSFYCWGSVGVVILSTVFFSIFGTQNWRILALLWTLIPLINGLICIRIPIASFSENGDTGLSISGLLKNRIFWLFLILMMCAGASEQAVSQWASTFAEQGLGVSKTIGDLAGPCMFSILMGISRVIFGKYGEKINLGRMMLISSVLCVSSYLLIGLTASPIWGLVGVGVCGFSVGILWPGTFSKASKSIRGGGTAMFAMLALAGDLGCSGGPAFVGMMADRFDDKLRIGILTAAIIPTILILGLILLFQHEKNVHN